MSETTILPALLSDERLKAIRQWAAFPLAEVSRHPHQYVTALADLLAHIAAQQATFATRDAELCATFDAYCAQVAEVLRGLLTDPEAMDNLFDRRKNERIRQNERLHAAAKALSLTL